MKLNKLIALLLAVTMLFAFVGCSHGNEPETPTEPAEQIPEDSIRNWNEDTEVNEFKVYKVADLKFLSETVNAGNSLEGITITLANDINIQAEGVTVLKDGFLEPDEKEPGEPAEGLVNLDSIGMRGKAFAGTFDGNGKTISGLYIYGKHQGLAFIGSSNGATIKNVILRDACIVPANIDVYDENGVLAVRPSADADDPQDGHDDDRFGGIVGLAEGDTVIENCIFEGVVGSKAAKDRNNGIEYGDSLIGRTDSDITTIKITHCISLARVYASRYAKSPVVETEVAYFDASNATQLAAGKAAIEAELAALAAPVAEEPAPEAPAEGEAPAAE